MNIILAVNEKSIEKYISTMKEVNVLKVERSNRRLLQNTLDLNPHIVVIAKGLPGKENIQEIIVQLREKQPHTRIVFFYGNDDEVRKGFTNFLIENGVYDFHVGAIDEITINDLLLKRKNIDDVEIYDLTEEEKIEIQKQEQLKKEYLEDLRRTIEEDVQKDIHIEDKTEEEIKEEIENKIDEKVSSQLNNQLEVHIIERIEEVEKIVEVEKIKTVFETKVIKQKTYCCMGLYNSTLKDAFVSNIAHLLDETVNQKMLIIDFNAPFPMLDHHFNTDKHIYINELHSSKKLTGVSGCLSAMKKNIFDMTTFKQFVKKVNGYESIDLLTGIYDIGDFDSLEQDEIKKIIDCAKKLYDTIIISVPSGINDLLTYQSIIEADKVILVTENTYANARADFEFIKEFTNFQKQPLSKFEILLYGDNVDSSTIEKLYKDYSVLGILSNNDNYINALNQKKIYLASYGTKKDKEEYLSIVQKLGYIPKEKAFINKLINKTFKLLKGGK